MRTVTKEGKTLILQHDDFQILADIMLLSLRLEIAVKALQTRGLVEGMLNVVPSPVFRDLVKSYTQKQEWGKLADLLYRYELDLYIKSEEM